MRVIAAEAAAELQAAAAARGAAEVANVTTEGKAAVVWLIAAAAVTAAAVATMGRAAAVRLIAAAATEQLPMQRTGRRQPNSHEKWQTTTCKQAEVQSARVS